MSPRDYEGDPASFARDRANVMAIIGRQHIVPHHIDSATGQTSAVTFVFEKQRITASLQGLYGCTSLVVLSRAGAWVSHV